MKVEVILTGHDAYLEVDGKKIAVLYGITKRELGVNKLYLSNEGGFIATVFNAKIKDEFSEVSGRRIQ